MPIDVLKNGQLATVVINRPDAMNAMTAEMFRQMARAFTDLEQDAQVRAAIVSGAGSKAFSAGVDIKEMKDFTSVEAQAHIGSLVDVFDGIERFPKPVIAAVNGYALGAGCEICLAADIRICSDSARFGQPEVGIGVLPGGGATQRLPRAVGLGHAKEMIYTGRMVDAQEALRWGLVNAVYPAERLMDEARALAEKIVANAPQAVYAAKSAINQGASAHLAFGRAYEIGMWAYLFSTEDQKEGMSAFLEKRKPKFTGK